MLSLTVSLVFGLVTLIAIIYMTRSTQRGLAEFQKQVNRDLSEKDSGLRMELNQTMQQGRTDLQQQLTQTTLTLEQKVTALDSKIDSKLGTIQHQVQDKLEQNLKQSFKNFEKVQEHLHFAGRQLKDLNDIGQSVHDLNNLLKLPHLRGGFGEATLERMLCDLLPPNQFELQYKIVPNSPERVDAIIRYPNNVLPVDSKFPREQILPLFETNDPSALEEARKGLAEAIKIQAKSIKEKYIHPEFGTTDMALLFVPSETLYFEILRNIKLCESLSKLKIFAVSPNTFAVTLHSISVARDYYEMAKGVEKTIAEVKKAQKHFENFERRFQEIGRNLKKAQGAFDMADTHLGRYDSAVNRLSSTVGENSELSLPEGNA